MSDKARKRVHAEFNKNRDKPIDELADMDIDDRTSSFEDPQNRYQKILAQRKEEKYMREQSKNKKIHIGKRKHIEKRAIAESEE